MTDSTGVFQHAIFSVPNFSEGYCTDDNARAFILAVLLGELGEDAGARAVRSRRHPPRFFTTRSIATTKRFHNHMSFDRHWLDEQGSEDCQAGRCGRWASGWGGRRLPQLPDDGRPAVRRGAACR